MEENKNYCRGNIPSSPRSFYDSLKDISCGSNFSSLRYLSDAITFLSIPSLSHQLKRPVYLLRFRIISLQFDRIAKFRFCQAEFP